MPFFCKIKYKKAYNIMGDLYMEKKLPKVFANSLNEVHNNDTVFYSADSGTLKEIVNNDGDRSAEEQLEIKQLKGTTVN